MDTIRNQKKPGVALEECCICYFKMDGIDQNLRRLSCGHEFHLTCVERWFDGNKNTCPYCRQVETNSKVQDTFCMNDIENPNRHVERTVVTIMESESDVGISDDSDDESYIDRLSSNSSYNDNL